MKPIIVLNKDNYCIVKLLIFIYIALIASLAHGHDKTTITIKGAKMPMKSYYIGRFSIGIPTELNEADGSRSQQLRYADIKEVPWQKGMSHEKARELEWNKFTAKTKALTPPKGKDQVIIKTQNFSGSGKWTNGAFYYDYYGRPRTATWAFLMDTGTIGLWIKTRPVVVEKENISHKSINNLVNISKHYIDTKTPGNYFFLKYGAIDLPYSSQEKTYIRFEGHPLDLKLEVEMDMDTRYKRPQHGLMDKVSSAIVSGFASAANVSVKKIRSHKREVAGMPGEEVINWLTDKSEKELNFAWEYIGKDDSGEYPTTRITMESPDGNLEEKLKIWDAILDSMKPMYERKK